MTDQTCSECGAPMREKSMPTSTPEGEDSLFFYEVCSNAACLSHTHV